MALRAIRGATTVDKNDKEEIIKDTTDLLNEIIKDNNLGIEDIISIIFTATHDLDQGYPAVAARNLNITEAALLCMQELKVENSLNMCVRVLMHVETEKAQKDMKAVYIKGAKVLRPDLAK